MKNCSCTCHDDAVRAKGAALVAAAQEPPAVVDAPCKCWGTVGVILPHEGHCCMTEEATDEGCHQEAGMVEYQAAMKAAGRC